MGSFSDPVQGTESRGLELCGENRGGLSLFLGPNFSHWAFGKAHKRETERGEGPKRPKKAFGSQSESVNSTVTLKRRTVFS